MADSLVTVHDVFDLPRPGSPEESSPRWRSLHHWINEDLAAAKSPAMEDVGATIEELLHIPVSDIFVKSWKETDAVKELLAESRKSPHSVTDAELADHTIKSKHHPHIEVRLKKGISKKIEFTLRLVFKLQGFSLRIQNGDIKEIRTGLCEMEGTFEYQGLAVVEKNNAPIELPQVIVVRDAQRVEVGEPAPAKGAMPVTAPDPLESKSNEPGPPPQLIAPKVITAATPMPGVKPKENENASPRLTATERVQSSPDFSSLIPPRKITPQKSEPIVPPKVSDSRPDVAATESVDQEEEREVFVL